MSPGCELMTVANVEVMNVWVLPEVISANSSNESKEFEVCVMVTR